VRQGTFAEQRDDGKRKSSRAGGPERERHRHARSMRSGRGGRVRRVGRSDSPFANSFSPANLPSERNPCANRLRSVAHTKRDAGNRRVRVLRFCHVVRQTDRRARARDQTSARVESVDGLDLSCNFIALRPADGGQAPARPMPRRGAAHVCCIQRYITMRWGWVLGAFIFVFEARTGRLRPRRGAFAPPPAAKRCFGGIGEQSRQDFVGLGGGRGVFGPGASGGYADCPAGACAAAGRSGFLHQPDRFFRK
jgi:hypothetical protein